MLVVQCRRCQRRMRYQPTGGLVSEKKKRCVFCGHTFRVHPSLPESRIIAVESP